MNLTEEQNEILTMDLDKRVIGRINAFAGTGKTFMLTKLAEAWPSKKFLYLSFNRAAKEDAQARMPANVTCLTSHSLAYRKFGKNYTIDNPQLRLIKEKLNLPYEYSRFVLDTLKAWLQSNQPKISEDSIPQWLYVYHEIEGTKVLDYAKYAQSLWEEMLSGKISMPHDGYLKLYQLSGPKISYDCIFLDEAQDTSPCVFDIVSNQKASQIYVGDKYQSIYQWRGAMNVMDYIHPSHDFYLTQSFRFGPEIGELATNLLFNFFGEAKAVKGAESTDTSIFTPRTAPRLLDFDHIVLLARTNATLFEGMLTHRDHKIAHVGGASAFKFDDIMDVYRLYSNEVFKAKGGYVKSFKSYEHFKTFSTRVHDYSSLMCCGVAERYNTTLPQLIEDIKRKLLPQTQAKYTFVTAHRAKGLEFDNVLIAPDFEDALAKEDEDGQGVSEELRLLYVAITRAKKGLYLQDNILKYIQSGNKEVLSQGRGENNYGHTLRKGGSEI